MADTTHADAGAAPAGTLLCQVITPEKTVFSRTVDFVALPLFDGELGVLPGGPLLGRLGYGELRVKAGGTTESFFVDGGFAQIRDDVVTVLTNGAIPPAAIEMNGTAAKLDEALKRPAATDAEVIQKTKDVARLRAMIHVSRKA